MTIEVQIEGSRVAPMEVRRDIGRRQLTQRIAEKFGVEGDFELLADGHEPDEPFRLAGARRYEILRREVLEERMQFKTEDPMMTQITIIHGRNCERTSVRADTSEGELRREIVRRFGADPGGRWCVRTMDGMYNPQAFKIQQMWVYTLEEEAPKDDTIKLGAPQDRQYTLMSRNAVEVEMRYGEGRKRTHVPDNVSEEQMVQLLVSGFGENVRKQWQVKTRNMTERVM
jgi:hypothetical protein